MRNPVTIPSMRAPPVGRAVHKFLESNPQSTLQTGSSNGSAPNMLIDHPIRDESIEAKWEQLQYYETKDQWSSVPENPAAEVSMTSTGSSASSSSGSGSGSSGSDGTQSADFRYYASHHHQQLPQQQTGNATADRIRRKLQKVKTSSLKKLSSGLRLFHVNINNAASSSGTGSKQNGPRGLPEVSTTPGGVTSVLPKLRASKSMQNLEQITRDSIYNLKDATSNLRQKYNSRMELRQRSQMYSEFWDEDDYEHGQNQEQNDRVEFQDLSNAVIVPARYHNHF